MGGKVWLWRRRAATTGEEDKVVVEEDEEKELETRDGEDAVVLTPAREDENNAAEFSCGEDANEYAVADLTACWEEVKSEEAGRLCKVGRGLAAGRTIKRL